MPTTATTTGAETATTNYQRMEMAASTMALVVTTVTDPAEVVALVDNGDGEMATADRQLITIPCIMVLLAAAEGHHQAPPMTITEVVGTIAMAHQVVNIVMVTMIVIEIDTDMVQAPRDGIVENGAEVCSEEIGDAEMTEMTTMTDAEIAA